MTPKEIFNKTLPFVWLKLALKMVFVVINVTALTIMVWGLLSQGARMEIGGGEIFSHDNFSFLIAPAIIFFIVIPVLSFVLRVYGRYMVRVGHIAVIVQTIKKGKVPKNQISYGFGVARKNFVRANMFFMMDRLIHRTVMELQTPMRGVLVGFGPLAVIATMFKGNLMNKIDECCLGYTFMYKDVTPFRGAVYGIVTYVNGWRAMAKRALIITVEVIGLTVLFYLLGGIMLYVSVTSHNFVGIVLSFSIIFLVGAVKSCVLDSYAMVAMLVSFLREARKQNNTPEEFVKKIEKVALMSGAFGTFVFQANRNEPFLSDDDETRILAIGRNSSMMFRNDRS